ncbi:helix-turn-helix domain-containing protein [Saccharothrix obliqua]|uniref:helix-turn-helix domain-containing protein n=1 Tax=Saccharothrix obliqua TaxID=2861747 RepID=UPI001C5FA1D5|nr:helix-turn-helix transcriptional regulator [Saccharothrix obliqua]MBW4715710.1 helix-turn-helix domain-containing protein [Saccharothrix obliqua]
MSLSTTPTVIRRYLAFELKRLREAAGLHQTDAAKRIDTTKGRIGHFETGRNLPKLPDVELLLPFYGAPELVETFCELIVQVRTSPVVFESDDLASLPPGFDFYLGLEQGASRIFTYDAVVVTGILQCRRYAEAAIRGHFTELSDDLLADLVGLRMRRQEALDRTEGPLHVDVVLDEAILRKEIGGRDVAVEQLDRLKTLAQRPNVVIRVLPYSVGAHPSLHGSFTLLEFPIERDPGVVYLEDRTGGSYRDDGGNIDEYTAVARRLMELALPERKSLSLIDSIRRELAS